MTVPHGPNQLLAQTFIRQKVGRSDLQAFLGGSNQRLVENARPGGAALRRAAVYHHGREAIAVFFSRFSREIFIADQNLS
jgi:hypothetical protein